MKKVQYFMSIMIPALAFVTSGCAKGSGDSNPDHAPAGQPKITTNTSQCSSGSAPSSAIGSWETDFEMNQKSAAISFQVVLTIEQNQVTLMNTCTINGQQLTSTVSAPARVSNTTITVLADASHTEEAGDETNHMDCTASLKKMTIQYQASGSCLSMKGLNPNETRIMVPAYQGSSTPNNPNGYPNGNTPSGFPPSGFPPPTTGGHNQPPNYPTPGYPTPSYPTPNYPGPNYPTPNFPTPTFPTPSFPGFPGGSFPSQN